MRKTPENLIKLVKTLNDNQSHYGPVLAKELNITRAAIWKAVKKLQNYGIKVDASIKNGYLLKEKLELLDDKKISCVLNLQSKYILEVLESVDSTNDYLKQYYGTNVSRFCVAEHQDKARGRLKRAWYAPYGKNIYLSCYYLLNFDINNLSGLSLAVGLAVVFALRKITGEGNIFSLKWPNDIICNNKKLGGCLIEMDAEVNGMTSIIIGIGLNINMDDDHGEINQDWCSLKQVLGKEFSRNELVAEIINNLDNIIIPRFISYGFKPFQEEWSKVDFLYDKQITMNNFSDSFYGKAKGVNDQGLLIIEQANGSIKTFANGDSSIAK